MFEKRILLCEDHQNLRKMFVDLLEIQGHQVLDFGTADEMLQLGWDEFASFDVLLADIEMPGTNGTELAKTISVLYPAISIFLMSGEFVDREVIKPIPAKFFLKPFRVPDLLSAIQNAMPSDRNSTHRYSTAMPSQLFEKV